MMCREIVGRRVRLLRKVTTGGGWFFEAGRLMSCEGTAAGRFSLRTIPKEPDIKNADGSISNHSGIAGVPRDAFEVIP